jgi:hypothetical protein
MEIIAVHFKSYTKCMSKLHCMYKMQNFLMLLRDMHALQRVE